jgi:hypothetical protein
MMAVADISNDYNLLLTSFNTLAEEFFDKMIKLFPNEKKIRGYQLGFKAAKKYNNKKPVEMFMNNLLPFGKQIIHRDETFFKQDEYIDHVQNLSGKMGLIKYWDDMSKENQNSIWEYMQSLYMLGMNIIGRKNELMFIMKNNKTIKQ